MLVLSIDRCGFHEIMFKARQFVKIGLIGGSALFCHIVSLNYNEFNRLIFFIYSNADLLHDRLANIKFLLVLAVSWPQKAILIPLLCLQDPACRSRELQPMKLGHPKLLI